MTTERLHTRKPLALLGGIGILVIGHSLIQDSPAHFVRTLPFLLMLILGELVREWTVGRLSPATDEDTARRRRRLGWIAGIAGMLLMTAPLLGLVVEWLPKRSLWVYALFGASMVCAGITTAVMFVGANAALAVKRAEAASTGRPLAGDPPGPLAFVLVFLVALVLFAMANATAMDSLFTHHALSSRQWVRLIVSAVLCGGLAVVVMRKLNEAADRPFDPANPDPP